LSILSVNIVGWCYLTTSGDGDAEKFDGDPKDEPTPRPGFHRSKIEK